MQGDDRTLTQGLLGVGNGLSGETTQCQNGLKHPRCGRPAKETSRCLGRPPRLSPRSPSQQFSLFLSASKKNVLFLSVGSFGNLRCTVTSRSLVPSGQHAALRGGLPVGARSQSTFPSELLVRLPLASPFKPPLQPTTRSPGRRTGPALARDLRELGGSWRARGAGCAEIGAPGRAHRTGLAELGARRLQHHGQVARSRRAARPAASP